MEKLITSSLRITILLIVFASLVLCALFVLGDTIFLVGVTCLWLGMIGIVCALYFQYLLQAKKQYIVGGVRKSRRMRRDVYRTLGIGLVIIGLILIGAVATLRT